ncbi:MAG: transposase [Ignavibacteria bacterium]|nr:transposase [Ignavibacteria bacterium]
MFDHLDVLRVILPIWRDGSRVEGIVGVVMESTGSYWIPVYEILESHGFRVALVNASHVKNAPGRKSDVQDCQWLQKIYSVGLLRDSFIPTESIRRLRSYTRLKEDHIRRASSHIQHMHKAFDQMNIKFHQVLSETAGGQYEGYEGNSCRRAFGFGVIIVV